MQAEPQHGERMTWEPQRAEQGILKLMPGGHKRRHQLLIRRGVRAKCLTGFRHGTLEESCRAVIEGMRQRSRRIYPLQTVLAQGQRAEERGSDPERIDCRTDIVHKAWQRELS